MFKLPNQLPSRHAGVHELADFAEVMCCLDGQISLQGLSRYLVRMDDNDINEGCDDTEDIIHEKMDDVIFEMQRREEACAGGYPFTWKLSRNGGVIVFNADERSCIDAAVYVYLLLGTRLKMDRDRTHAGIDGTNLLEHLAEHVVGAFLGPKSKSFTFGTAAGGSFQDRVNALCRELGEGGRLREEEAKTAARAQDGGLDTVAWIPFADRQTGKLVVFGQCKTGTGWREHATRLQPRDFVDRWLTDPILVEPVRAHFVAEAISPEEWRRLSISAGLLFDRCRLVEYGAHLPEPVLADLAAWTSAARTWVAKAIAAA